jgi:hypothetical protein
MRKSSFAALALIGSVALVGAAVTPAMAADENTVSNEAVTIEVEPGFIVISAPAAPVPLASSAEGGLLYAGNDATATFPDITVTDEKGGKADWTATVALTDFIGTAATNPADETISVTDATYTPGAAVKDATLGESTVAASGVLTTLATTQAQQSATLVSGNNSAVWTAVLSVPIPLSALAGSYTATLTHSLIPLS